jgi:resuscitation-promoting factor RpfB
MATSAPPLGRTAAPSPTSPSTAPAGGPWAELRQCESGGNYAEDTGNGYYGAYQFAAATWHGLGLPGLPNQASPAAQDAAAAELQARSGWGQWPACSRKLGL